MHRMINATLTFLGQVAEHRRVVGSWLVVLTLAVGQLGEKVYVSRTRELAVAETQLSQVLEQLKRMDAKLDQNGERLLAILVEQARVKQELLNEQSLTNQRIKELMAADARIQHAIDEHAKKDKI